MDKEYDAWWRRRILAALLSGLAGYIRTASSPSPQTRRLRYVTLFAPILGELTTRLSMRWARGPEGQPEGTFNCLPTVLLMLTSAGYWLYIHLSAPKRRT